MSKWRPIQRRESSSGKGELSGTLDSFRKMSKKEYTFDNGRKGQGSVVSRIDKFLVS
jgi:hypothetical protein